MTAAQACASKVQCANCAHKQDRGTVITCPIFGQLRLAKFERRCDRFQLVRR